MDYPRRLIPKSFYKKIQDVSVISKVYLLHHVDPGIPCKKFNEIKANISRIMIPGRYYNGMSFSLFTRTTIDDMRIKIINDEAGKYQCAWNEGEHGVLPNINDFSYIKCRKVVSVKMRDILSFQAKSHIGSDKDREDVMIRLKPEHAPINVNYWHFNLFLEVKKVSDNSVVECKKDRTKRLATALNDDFAFIIHPARKSQRRYVNKAVYQYSDVL